ncbi:MAG: FliO/MopB family protein [Alphaproteobacteria bacterium]|nr:FliO/MopB family protein [Alphaproteobacteria bacterium]MBP7758403.1 FliO/MopB family protein [Alphaproteobacteria bacterium]MBP7762398.1 FliO/MopB family protein [Alphaproteobacteria bacterium]MBP7903921.1 FliO/MopB family protein [Alphaproteobacteria bacterium]
MSPDDLFSIGRMLAALVFVLALMGGLALVLKRLGLSGITPHIQGKKRLKIIETLPIDSRRRLVLFQCDDEQHLVVLGLSGETVIKTGIKPVADSPDAVDASQEANR